MIAAGVDVWSSLQGGVQDACKDAGLDDANASRFNDMALYAAYAISASVRKSGQSAFTWIPLQGVVQAALEAVPEAGRAAFTQTFIAAVTGVTQAPFLVSANWLGLHASTMSDDTGALSLAGSIRTAPVLLARTAFSHMHCWIQLLKHVEEQESLDDVSGPPDLVEGSRLLQNIMSSTNKVPVLDSNATLMDTSQSIVRVDHAVR